MVILKSMLMNRAVRAQSLLQFKSIIPYKYQLTIILPSHPPPNQKTHPLLIQRIGRYIFLLQALHQRKASNHFLEKRMMWRRTDLSQLGKRQKAEMANFLTLGDGQSEIATFIFSWIRCVTCLDRSFIMMSLPVMAMKDIFQSQNWQKKELSYHQQQSILIKSSSFFSYNLYLLLKNFCMLQSNSKEERKNGNDSIKMLNQINKSDEDPPLFAGNKPTQTENDTHPTHEPEPYSADNHHQNYDQIDGFFDFWSNVDQRIQEEDSKPFEPYEPQRNDRDQRSFSMSEVTEITMTNLDSHVTNIYQSEVIQPSASKKPRPPVEQSLQRPPVEQQAQGNRFNHTSEKNIIGYITKKAIKIALKKYSLKLMKACQQAGIQSQDFFDLYQDYEKKIYGPVKIAAMLRISDREEEKVRKMKKIFYVYFVKVLRRDYLIQALKKGKMVDMQQYLCRKNNHLLYFAESIFG